VVYRVLPTYRSVRGERRPSGEIGTENATERRFANRRLTASNQGAYLHMHDRRMTDSGRWTLTRLPKGPRRLGSAAKALRTGCEWLPP